MNPKNAHGAHGFAHVCYESGEPETARAYLSSWLSTYPRDGFFYGHLSWHLSLCELQLGNWAQALQLYRDAIALDRHSGGPQQKMSDGDGIFMALGTRGPSARYRRLARAVRLCEERVADSRAAGSPTCTSSWLRLLWAMMPRSMPELVKWRIWRTRGVTRPALIFRSWHAASRRSNAGGFCAAIEALAPLAGENERIGGSRAQHDLIEFTLLKAYLNAQRLEDARVLLGARRPELLAFPSTGLRRCSDRRKRPGHTGMAWDRVAERRAAARGRDRRRYRRGCADPLLRGR